MWACCREYVPVFPACCQSYNVMMEIGSYTPARTWTTAVQGEICT